jgi:transcription elongation factor GreA
VYDVDTEEEQRFKIVGDDEADVTNGKVSVSSPMARALIGRTEGDDVRVKTPKGLRQIEIVKVEFV